jgi:carbon monoxide dehydrogenase subunit G
VLIENSFDVAQPIDRVWAYLLDVERVVPCMPGAELTETIDDHSWKGKVKVKLGPVSLSFNGKVSMEEQDASAHRIVLKGSGMEQRGKGAASATVTSTLEAVDGGTRVNVVQDLKVQGQAAQFSRGMMQDVTTKLTKQFAECLQANMEAEEEGEAEAPAGRAEPAPAAEAQPAAATGGAQPTEAAASPPRPAPQVTAKPIGGIGLALSALWSAIVRFVKRLLGRKSQT